MAKATTIAKRAHAELAAPDLRTTMHGQHRQFLAEHALWHDEIKLWQDELKRLLDEMSSVKQRLRGHQDAIRQHAAAARLYEQSLQRQAQDLANYERGRPTVAASELSTRHRGVEANHRRQRDVHEQLKRSHHTLIAHWNLLVKALAETAPLA